MELDSLPDGVGITKQTKFFNPDVTEQTIILATVDRAETELSGTEVKPTFYSADNVQLLADYEVVLSDNAYATMPWESIDAMDSFTLSGAFVDGNMAIPYLISVDISEANVVEKYTTLYDYGMISEREMVLAQCDVLSEPENIYMRTPEIMGAIEEYRDKLKERSISIDSGTIAMYDAQTSNPDLTLIEDVLTYETASLTTGRSKTEIAAGTHAIVTSDLPRTSDLETFAAAIVNEMDDIHTYFVTMVDFGAPNSTTGTNGKMAIEIVDNNYVDESGKSMHNVYGLTYRDNYILINYDYKDYGTTDKWKTTLAHEYQHAIQNTYATGYKDSWLSESTANFASAMYALYAFNVSYGYRSYFIHDHLYSIECYHNSPALSLNKVMADPNSRHTSLLFPAYLYFNTGIDGWDTIKEIYETSFGRSITATPDIYTEIDQALKNLNSTYSFKTFFENFAIDDLFPKSAYGTLYDSYYDVIWPAHAQNYISVEAAIPSSTCAVEPVAVIYNAITDAPDSDITVTIDIYQGSFSDLVIWTLTHTNSLEKTAIPPNPIDPIRHILPGSRITIQHQHGYPSYPFNVITVNTSFSNEVRYSITVSS